MTEVLTKAPDIPEVGKADAPITGTGHPSEGELSGEQNDPRTTVYANLFDRTPRADEPTWLSALRKGAIDRFTQVGFPTRKNEDWHFTSVAPIADRNFEVQTVAAETSVTSEQIAQFKFADDWYTFVFVNGHFSSTLSNLPEKSAKIVVSTFRDAVLNDERSIEQHLAGLASSQSNAFTALNTAFLQDGLYVAIDANEVLDRPIHLMFIADENAEGMMISPRNLILVDRHAEVSIMETYIALGESTYLTNAVTEIYMSPGSRVRHYKLQREGMAAYHVGSSYAYQQANSHYESFSYAVGADLSRTNIYTVLDGEGGHATLNGLYMVDGHQVVDHQTRIEHAKENCTSHEMYKGVLDGHSHGVFNGKVYVRPEAQKTDGKQSNNNLLLSENAEIDTKPQLEIYADDVRCTHGATIGRLDDNSLFYMKSRGIGTDMARKLLTYAFAAEVLEELTLDPVKDKLESLAFMRFAK